MALVVLATCVATFAGRLRVPAPSLLVLAGLGVALVPGLPTVRVSPEIIATVVLPPLLYASAKEISARDLRAMWRPLAGLALGLVAATAAGVAGLALAITSLSVPMAFVLGAVLASTDPVAVTALGRTLPLPARIQALAQAESLFNDATSLVLFQVAVGLAAGSSTADWAGAGWRFLVLAVGGAGIGAVVAGIVVAVRARAADPILHTVLALVTPYAAYLLAQAVGVSGVTAVVVAGVVLGSTGHKITDARTRLQVGAVYDVVVFLLESVVFALIGLQLPALVRDLPVGSGWWPLQAGALAVALIGIRFIWVRPTVSRAAPTRAYPAWPLTRVLVWAGTRGVMPLAAALAIPLTSQDGRVIADRPLVLVLTTAVVAAMLIVQGFSLAPVVRSSGLAVDPVRIAEKERAARVVLDETALAFLDAVEQDAEAGNATVEGLRRRYAARLDAHTDEARSDTGYDRLQRAIIGVQRAELRRLRREGGIGDGMERRLQHELDRAEAALDR
ncbi:Na+/H+ antiporter [Actinospica durhamensis]|uniref:Na+/H+ antiporter n=1 Tax=Actinospica durhamensis TaxID=1508375 RepID=UPI0027DD5616|nr:Na+/H+ antiporter [Actinospica durhamensis]